MKKEIKNPQTLLEGLFRFGIVCAGAVGIVFVIYLLMTCGL